MRRKKPANTLPQTVAPLVPKVLPEIPGQFAANMLWLQTNWTNYKDRWVALHNGNLIVSCGNQEDLQPSIVNHPFLSNIMCLKVGEDYYE